jgi:hypothetical protein
MTMLESVAPIKEPSTTAAMMRPRAVVSRNLLTIDRYSSSAIALLAADCNRSGKSAGTGDAA